MIKSNVKMSSNENRMVPNNQIKVHLWSLSLVLLHFITIISTQGIYHFSHCLTKKKKKKFLKNN